VIEALDTAPERDMAQVIAAYVVGIAMFMAIMLGAQYVAMGVVEEKTSRVVELLLSTVRPAQLMAGKILGIGTVALIQVGLTLVAAVIGAQIAGLLDGTGLEVGSTLFWSLAWFLVGFATFATFIAALAALVSRQEEVGSVTTPATMLMILPYVFGVNVLPWDPENTLAAILSWVPGFAPFLMPMRAALGSAGTWEVAGSLLLNIAVLPLLVWFAGRVYSNAVLRTGARIKLAEAMKPA